MVTITHCPICGLELQPNAKQFMSAPTFEVTIEGLEFRACAFVTYAQCPGCHLYAQSPRMSDDNVTNYYKTGSYRKWLNQAQEKLDADERRRAQIDSKILFELLAGYNYEDHLDIGSSRGYFLEEMGAGVQVGVDPNLDYNTNPRAEVFADMNIVAEGYGQFDLVSAIHSLEHTLDPMQSLADMATLCRKFLVIEVPSEQSPGGWGRLAHTFHFPENVFFILADKIGFKVKVIAHTPHTLVIMERKHELDES